MINVDFKQKKCLNMGALSDAVYTQHGLGCKMKLDISSHILPFLFFAFCVLVIMIE